MDATLNNQTPTAEEFDMDAIEREYRDAAYREECADIAHRTFESIIVSFEECSAKLAELVGALEIVAEEFSCDPVIECKATAMACHTKLIDAKADLIHAAIF